MKIINERIAVGSSADGRNEQGLILAGYTAAVNVAVDLDMPHYEWIVGKKAGLICGPGNSLESFGQAVALVEKLLKIHPKVMIFCHSGRDRSPLVASVVLASMERISLRKAYEKVDKALIEGFLYPNAEVEKALTGVAFAWQKQQGEGVYKVSIVMPSYKRPELSERCLMSLRRNTEYQPVEIVGVDDGSQDDASLEVLERYCDIVVRHETNEGIAKSRADGMAAATGELICQIDNDCVFFRGWLVPLVETLLRGDRVAIVSPLFTFNTAYFADRLESIGGDNCYAVEEVGSACMLFRRELVDAIGTFDATLYNLWSDKDFCYRLSKAEMVKHPEPHRIVVDPRVCVYHHGYVDPKTGEWEIETEKNTRGLIANSGQDQESMRIIYERWRVRHPLYEATTA